MPLRSVVVVMLFAFVPTALAVPEDPTSAPTLTAEPLEPGHLLSWQGGRDVDVEQFELWRFSHSSDLPTWKKVAELNGTISWHFDRHDLDADQTWYALVAYYEDGVVAVSEPSASTDYPHCDWLFLTIPPTLREECLMPPPWPVDFVVETVTEVTATE